MPIRRVACVLAAGLGEVLRQPKFEPPDVLRYARIGGVEYGTPIYRVPAEPEPGRPPSLGVSAWPNPVRVGLARVSLTVPEVAQVRVEVVDLLGRAVAALDLGVRRAGVHEAALDLARLAPGTYLLRLAAGAEASVRGITLLR